MQPFSFSAQLALAARFISPLTIPRQPSPQQHSGSASPPEPFSLLWPSPAAQFPSLLLLSLLLAHNTLSPSTTAARMLLFIAGPAPPLYCSSELSVRIGELPSPCCCIRGALRAIAALASLCSDEPTIVP
jgi:hypothetical protein